MTYERHVHILETEEYPETQPSKRFLLACLRTYRSAARETMLVVDYRIVLVKRHFSKTLMIKPFRAPLYLPKIFSSRYSGQGILLTWKNSSWSTTIALNKVVVRFNSCYPRASRATASPLISFHNALIRE